MCVWVCEWVRVCVCMRERERVCACVYTYEKASAYEIEDRGTSGNRESEDILRVKGFRGGALSLTQGQWDWKYQMRESAYPWKFYFLLYKQSRWEGSKKKISRRRNGAFRLTALCPTHTLWCTVDSDVNIMAFICVVYASIQRCCSRILTYL